MKDKNWYLSKTVWAGVAMIVVAAADGLFGFDLGVESVTTFLLGLVAIFLRQAVGESGPTIVKK